MLTKELISAKVRNGSIYPHFLTEKEVALYYGELQPLFEKSVGKSQKDFEAELSVAEGPKPLVTKGLVKILRGQIEEEEYGPKVEEVRWEIFKSSQELRDAKNYSSVESFQEEIARDRGVSWESLCDSLYQDLPDQRKIRSFAAMSLRALTENYNCAQVQGLMLFANDLSVIIKEPSLRKRRAFLSRLRFHRLLAELESLEEERMHLKVSGPLQIFSQKQMYATRLCALLPSIFALEGWHIETTIKWKGKKVRLELDDQVSYPLRSSLQQGYLPKELSSFQESFTSLQSDWKLKESLPELLSTGELYIPDFLFQHKSSNFSVSLELFHRWHNYALERRLDHLGCKKKGNALCIGVCRSLAKQEKISVKLDSSRNFASFGLIFSEFPTAKSVLKMLEKAAAGTEL